MKPAYFLENAYSIYPRLNLISLSKDYEVETPETRFEWQVFNLFHKGKQHLYHEEFSLALDSFRELSQLILKTVHPTLPADPNANYYTAIPFLTELLDPMLTRAAEILRDTPITRYNFPESIVSQGHKLSPDVAAKVDKAGGAGLRISSHHGKISEIVELAVESANHNNWTVALDNYNLAFAEIPADDRELQAAVKHDMALIHEKLDKKDDAIRLATESANLFKTAENHEKQVESLRMLSGIQERNGQPDQAREVLKEADTLIKRHNLHRINTMTSGSSSVLTNPAVIGTGSIFTMATTATMRRSTVSNGEKPDAPMLMTMSYLAAQPATVKKTITINGQENNVSIDLSENLLTGMTGYYKDLAVTKDAGLLRGFLINPTQMVAYLPHMYFYVIPMAIADCEIGLGQILQASQRLEEILKYPYLNENVEVIAVWTKMADCFLDLGDESYKNAKDVVANYAVPRSLYEKIVKANGTIDNNSPLYKDAKLAGIKQRVTDVLNGAQAFIDGGVTLRDENPAILWRVRQADAMLSQIEAKLNFFGFDQDYIPPFSFEYLQETARYFAQHASQMEQKYIQYKSTAENEELRADQMTQQVELAQQSVLLEQRGVAEAQAGITVAEANRDYAETRRKNAVDQANEFNDVRWELLEYAEAEAWASASSVDRDDQVKLTWNGHYYNSSKKRRNVVIQELAYHKTRITHDLQASKLADEVAAATSYKAVAEAQIDQAKARKAVAEKRVEIAQLQQKHAEDNKEFLDLKEFGAGKWYDIAKRTKRLVTRYLEQATEIAFLMERAYNAESERGLKVIRYNYAPSYSGFLVGADQLTRDIDSFTFDYITNVKTKKAPVKKTISLSDLAPDALERLLSTGFCQFATTLADFDREFPGMYLCKIKNVELVFVGITQAVSIAGSLRNLGVSKFKSSNGTAHSRSYPADVMPLSQYDIRQDALAFRFNPRDLKLFENNGLETIWEIQLRKDANDFDLRDILDIQLILYYDGFHNKTLESSVIAALPASGNASRSISMQLYFPDELYYLLNNGEGIMEFDRQMFPFNQTSLKRDQTRLKVLGDPTATGNLTIELHSADKNDTVEVKTDNDGKVDAAKLNELKGGNMVDKWTITIPEADNPQLVQDGKLHLGGISDLIFLVDYSFDYQS